MKIPDEIWAWAYNDTGSGGAWRYEQSAADVAQEIGGHETAKPIKFTRAPEWVKVEDALPTHGDVWIARTSHDDEIEAVPWHFVHRFQDGITYWRQCEARPQPPEDCK
jgi:hypothetical protein